MKVSLPAIFCLSVLLFPGATVLPQNGKTVRVLTYNIYHGETMKGNFDLDLIARVIKNTGAELVALQEVDFKTKRARGYDLATELGWRTRKASLFGRAMYYDSGEYGEAILSSHSFVASRNNPLPYTQGKEPRAALEVTTVLPSGDTIIFIATHLDHTEADTDRVMQAWKIRELLQGLRYPAILAGDLNDTPRSTPLKILLEHCGITYDEDSPAPTYPSGAPSEKIDYVLFYPKNRWRVASSEVTCDTLASDHCAHWVTLELLDK